MHRKHSNHDRLRMPTWMRRWVYVTGGVCLATGALWLLFHHFVRSESTFGPRAHPLEHIWLTVHGGVAFLMSWVFGLIWLVHVRRGWQRGRNRGSGTMMGLIIVMLVLSGWGLYYLSDEQWRNVISLLHWVIGVASGLWLPFHVWRGRRGIKC